MVIEHQLLTCPHCKGEHLHHVRASVLHRREEDDEITIKTTVEKTVSSVELVGSYLNPSPRRGAVVVEFECEDCDKQIEMVLTQHKGQTHMSMIWIGCFDEETEENQVTV